MAERIGLIPLREKIRELEGVYGRVQKEIASELFSVEIMNYQEIKSMKVQERIDTLIKKLNRAAIRWVKESVPMAYKKSYIVSKTSLEILGAKKDVLFNPQRHRLSIDDYIERTMQDLVTANQSIKNNVNMYLYLARRASAGLMQIQEFDPGDEAVISSIITDTMEAGRERAYASKRIHEYLRLKLLDGKFIDKAGRSYNLRGYSKMVARTRLRQAQTDAVKNTCGQYENDLVQVSQHASPCDLCAPYEGKIYSLSGKHPTYPFFDINIPLHPNCEHNISPTSEAAIEWREGKEIPLPPAPGYARPPGRAPWKPFKDLKQAEEWGKQYGIRGLTVKGKKLTIKEWNLVGKEINKIPGDILRRIRMKGGTMDLVVDSGITVHPSYVKYKGQTPRGWSKGTWDNVPGAGGTIANPKTVIVANKTGIGHGSINLVLHEHAHTIDAIYGKGYKKLSNSTNWQKVWKTNKNKGLISEPYEAAYAEEYWAESFAQYFNTPGHGYLPKNVTTYFDNIVKGAGR